MRVLARMEKVGVRVDVDLLRRIYDGLVAEGRRLEEEIQELCGSRFLVNSTQQLRRVLFDELGLQPQKKTKTGFSTDAASLEKLRGQHPVIEPLLRYREVEKLRSTYGEACWARWAPTGASTPASTRPSPAPAGSAPTGPTCTTSPSAPRRAGASARRSSPPRAGGSWWPTTTRSSCG